MTLYSYNMLEIFTSLKILPLHAVEFLFAVFLKSIFSSENSILIMTQSVKCQRIASVHNVPFFKYL